MKPRPPFLVVALLLAACVENEEEITIRADGSASVRLAAKGKAEDLADGYALPLEAPWSAQNEATLEWLRAVGPDTGSPATRAALASIAKRSETIQADQDVELEVAAEFASVSALPRLVAPASEPYRSAYLERTAELRVDEKGGRRVYTFERTFRRREFERFDVMGALKRGLDRDFLRKIEKNDDLTDDERSKLVDAGLVAMRWVSEAFARDALSSIYSQGDASVAPEAAVRVLDAVRSALEKAITRPRIEAIVLDAFPPQGTKRSGTAGEDSERLEQDARATLRATLEEGLQADRAPLAIQNAVRGELEWLFTAYDHTSDLADEHFSVSVRMPGTIVGGNWDETKDGAATWGFQGDELQDRDRVLRVISVVE